MTTASRIAVSQGDSLLEAQIASLLQRLDRHREQRTREVAEAAESQARALEREAWHEAAARGRAAVADARGRLDAGRNRTQAQLDAARRQQAQAEARSHLDELWRLLPTAIEALWRTPEQRRRWLQSALRVADSALVGRHWRIECAPGTSRAEVNAVIERLDLAVRIAADVVEQIDLAAGLRILADGACIDATTRGVLADVRAIEAAFLAACETEAPSTPDGGSPGTAND